MVRTDTDTGPATGTFSRVDLVGLLVQARLQDFGNETDSLTLTAVRTLALIVNHSERAQATEQRVESTQRTEATTPEPSDQNQFRDDDQQQHDKALTCTEGQGTASDSYW